jgi:hypothetical protein
MATSGSREALGTRMVVDEKPENIVSNEIKENVNGDVLKSNESYETHAERTCTCR